MKTSELTGVLLDYWVAKAEGKDVRLEVLPLNPPRIVGCASMEGRIFVGSCRASSDWAQGGHIIEREKITIEPFGDEWGAGIGGEVAKFYLAGPTPLVAAMRAYVASKFGEEVPDGTDIQNG